MLPPKFHGNLLPFLAPGRLLGRGHGLIAQPRGLAFQLLQRLLGHHVGRQVATQATLQPRKGGMGMGPGVIYPAKIAIEIVALPKIDDFHQRVGWGDMEIT